MSLVDAVDGLPAFEVVILEVKLYWIMVVVFCKPECHGLVFLVVARDNSCFKFPGRG